MSDEEIPVVPLLKLRAPKRYYVRFQWAPFVTSTPHKHDLDFRHCRSNQCVTCGKLFAIYGIPRKRASSSVFEAITKTSEHVDLDMTIIEPEMLDWSVDSVFEAPRQEILDTAILQPSTKRKITASGSPVLSRKKNRTL